MDLPAGYELRAPTARDLDAVGDVFAADDLDDAGEVVLDADFIRGMWSREGFDPASDAWVFANGAGGIVAYGHAMRDGPEIVDSLGIVHPEHRGRGLGSSLLDLIEERAARLLAGLPTSRFRHAINAGDRAAAAMLEARGLRPVRHFWHMGIDLDGPVDPGRPPDGIEIRGIEPREDLPAVHAVLTEAFADDWGYHPDPFERWAEDYESGPSYDPALWLLATDGAAPVGALDRGRARLGRGGRGPGVASWTRDRDRPPPPIVRDVRATGDPASDAERGCREPDRRDGALRARGDAGHEAMGPLGALGRAASRRPTSID